MMRHLPHDRLITVFFFAINLHQNELFASCLDGSMADASSAAAAATGAWQRYLHHKLTLLTLDKH